MNIDLLRVPNGISITALKVIYLCSQEPRDGKLLARDLNITAAAISGTAYNLEQRGLIKRRTDSRDRRRQVFSATRAGRELLAKCQCEPQSIALPA